MAIDLTSLSPAPWEVKTNKGSGGSYIPRSGGYPMLLPEDDSDARDMAALEFAVLARNAFAIMVRRGWWAVPGMDGKDNMLWKVETTDDSSDKVLEGRWWPDPYTALVAAAVLVKAKEQVAKPS